MTTCSEALTQCTDIRENERNGVYPGSPSTADWVPTVAHWQADLTCGGWGYSGPSDGYWGINSRMAVQRQVVQYGYGGPIDGVWGVNTWKAIQRMAQQGGYGGPIDGLPGSNTWYARWNLFRPHLREA